MCIRRGAEVELGIARCYGCKAVGNAERRDDAIVPTTQLGDALAETPRPIGRAGVAVGPRQGEAQLLQALTDRGCGGCRLRRRRGRGNGCRRDRGRARRLQEFAPVHRVHPLSASVGRIKADRRVIDNGKTPAGAISPEHRI